MADMSLKKKRAVSVHARRVIAYIVLILLSFLCLFWFYVLFINATRSNGELAKGFTAIPSTHLLKNLNNVLFHGAQDPIRGMINSFIIAGLSAVLSTYFSTMTAYAIHAYRFKGRKAIYTFILAVMMIPQAPVLAIATGSIPFIVVTLRPFFLSLPKALDEAARIDGAGEFRTFNIIALPLMKPAIAVQMVFTFVSSWNNYFTPALILKDKAKKTLPILLAELRGADFMKFDMGQVYAMIAFSIFPVIIVYLFLSRYIVGGVTAGGVKE